MTELMMATFTEPETIQLLLKNARGSSAITA